MAGVQTQAFTSVGRLLIIAVDFCRQDLRAEATIKLSSLRNEAYDQIRGRLALGQLAAGSEVSEPMLAELLGISRTPVREALQQLEVEGLVERKTKRKTVIRNPERQDILDLYELREALECYSVRLAAKRRPLADIVRLNLFCHEMKRSADELKRSGARVLSDAKLSRLMAADMGFHSLLIRAAGNRHIMKIVADSHVLSQLFGAPRQEHNLKKVKESYRVHRDVLIAVERSNADLACELIAAHIQQARDEALEYFDRSRSGSVAKAEPTFDSILPAYLLDEFRRTGSPLKDELS
jgi:DNA-binding GntR family transcriptional regulator